MYNRGGQCKLYPNDATMKITFIQTGGTIDKDYPRKTRGYAFEISEPAVKRILEKVNPGFVFEIVPFLRKDSLDITNKDRLKLLNFCKKLKERRIIITHGTDTIIQSAKTLSSIKDKIIVFTGAMRPEKFYDSDAMFNIGMAVGAVSSLPHGIYIVMNGQIFSPRHIERDKKTGNFIVN
jgi:L-asparaginase